MSRFNTLLLREWMQHHRGWLILMLAPPLLVLLLVPVGTVQFSAGEFGSAQPLHLMLLAMFATPVCVLAITAIAIAFQTPGLARRDQQDRSIEFWLSLPTGHSASIAATLLTHFVGVPLLALGIGALLSPLLGLALISKVFGAAAALQLPWGVLIATGVLGLLRAAFGVLLACLWLAPLLLVTMTASAWLKRWGVAALAILLSVGHALLSLVYGIALVGETLSALIVNARRAILHDLPPRTLGDVPTLDWLADLPAWLLHDALASLRELGQPLFLFALVVGAACFGLLVLRRSRNG